MGGLALNLGNLTVPSGYIVEVTPYALGHANPNWIPAGESFTFDLALNPNPEVIGTYAGNITFTNNDPGENPFSFPVTGVVVDRIISLSGNLAFGGVAVGASATNFLTISNGGNETLTVSNITFPTGFGSSWSNGTVAAASSLSVPVTFSPSAVST